MIPVSSSKNIDTSLIEVGTSSSQREPARRGRYRGIVTRNPDQEDHYLPHPDGSRFLPGHTERQRTFTRAQFLELGKLDLTIQKYIRHRRLTLERAQLLTEVEKSVICDETVAKCVMAKKITLNEALKLTLENAERLHSEFFQRCIFSNKCRVATIVELEEVDLVKYKDPFVQKCIDDEKIYFSEGARLTEEDRGNLTNEKLLKYEQAGIQTIGSICVLPKKEIEKLMNDAVQYGVLHQGFPMDEARALTQENLEKIKANEEKILAGVTTIFDVLGVEERSMPYLVRDDY